MLRAYERGVQSIGTSVRAPERLEGACESSKDPILAIALTIDVSF